MNGTKVPFATQKNGYDQDQVDRYLCKLTDEYSNLQQKYKELYAKYDAHAKQSDVGKTAISKAIVDAEVRAIQIIANANREAAQIKGSAHVELAHIKQEKDWVINEVYEMTSRLMSLVPSKAVDF